MIPNQSPFVAIGVSVFLSITVYPEIADGSPSLVGPVVEDDLYVMFYCDVFLTTSDLRAVILINFPNTNAPTQTITPEPGIRSTYRATLHEKYLTGAAPANNVGIFVWILLVLFKYSRGLHKAESKSQPKVNSDTL